MRKYSEEYLDGILSKYRFALSENEIERVSYSAETKLLDAVRRGDYRDIDVSRYFTLEKTPNNLIEDPLVNLKYATVSAVTLFCRVAISEGVSSAAAFDLGDVLFYEIYHAGTQADVIDLFQRSAMLYAKAVRNEMHRKNSYIVERAKNYVSRNIFRKITLQEIADSIGITPNYLSATFSKKEGMTLHNYIQREKMQTACNLLKYSSRPVSAIAQYMSFPSQSNFSQLFRKWIGMTPVQYRTRYQQESFKTTAKNGT